MTPNLHSHSSNLLWLTTCRHALVWLVVANFLGVILSCQLLWPNASWPTWFTFGRVMPLHMNFHLYGWLALPLVGLLIDWAVPHPQGSFRALFLLWSALLGWVGLAWLSGQVSGKLFLDWTPTWALTFATVIYCFWAQMLRLRIRFGQSWSTSQRQNNHWALLLSAPVGALMVWVSRPSVYPAINPQSGGATGTSLLGSSLSIVLILFLILHLHNRKNSNPINLLRLSPFLAIHLLYFALLKHSHSGNGDVFQQTGLFSLLTWPLLLRSPLKSISNTKVLKMWYRAFGIWAILLVLNGACLFLPGWLDRAKFSNLLVAHAHLAMAGLASSLVIYMICLLGGKQIEPLFARRESFWIWQGATLLMCGVLSWTGWHAYSHPGEFFENATWVRVIYSIRLCCGLALFGVSFYYFWRSLRLAVNDA